MLSISLFGNIETNIFVWLDDELEINLALSPCQFHKFTILSNELELSSMYS